MMTTTTATATSTGTRCLGIGVDHRGISGHLVTGCDHELAQVVGELAHQLLRDVGHHAASELCHLARHRQVGRHGDLRTDIGRLQLGGDVRCGVARSAGVTTLGTQDRPVADVVALQEGSGSLVLGGDRADLDLDHPAELVALDLEQLGSR